METDRVFRLSSFNLSCTVELEGMIRGLIAREWAFTGTMILALIWGWTIGPPTAKEYAVDPDGVEIKSLQALNIFNDRTNPSPEYVEKNSVLIKTSILQICPKEELKIETSFNAGKYAKNQQIKIIQSYAHFDYRS